MSPIAKKEYVQSLLRRYKEARKKQKTIILNEFCQNCGYNRKYAIEKINTFNATIPKKKPGKPSKYNCEAVLKVIKKIWFESNLPCGQRLHVILPLWLPFVGDVPEEIQQLILQASSATLDRLLKPSRIKLKSKGRCTTKPGTLLKNQIPIKGEQWNEQKPGFLEADTVAHCGGSLMGQFAYTLNCVDIATGWNEQRAIWSKGELGVLTQIKDIQHSLPFTLLGFDCDNGSEFLNHHLLRHFKSENIQFTRCRPYHKDENAHVEQKNWTHVRQWLGYYRFDNPGVVVLMNDLYKSEWRLLHNFFMPSVKLIYKNRVGSRTTKKFDCPKTPYQRILESQHIHQNIKDKLSQTFKTLDPFKLKKSMELKLNKIFFASRSLVSAPSIS